MRRAIDDRGVYGQFILTGSATPVDDITRHSGAGRISRMKMRPLSLFEAGQSSGQISFRRIMDGERSRAASHDMGIRELAAEIAAGGWPGLRAASISSEGEAMRDYLEEVTHLDLAQPDMPRHDPDRVGRLMRSLARNVATEASAATLARDSGEHGESPLSDDTVRSYLAALRRVFILENQPAWAPHLRSKYRLRRAAKLHFVDPGLAVAALGGSPESLLRDLNLLGLLFESLVVRDLRVYAQACGAKILHYRDESGLEADVVVERADGCWAAFEVKLGFAHADDAARSLLKLADRVDTSRCGEPVALGVILPGGVGFRREDGVHVIPLNALGP